MSRDLFRSDPVYRADAMRGIDDESPLRNGSVSFGLIFEAVASRAAITIAAVIGVAATRVYLLIC